MFKMDCKMRYFFITLFFVILFTQNIFADSELGVVPFQIPTYMDVVDDFKKPIAPIKRTQKIDEEMIFNMVLACYPSKSFFDGFNVSAKAGVGLAEDFDVDDKSGIGKHYFGIVASLPLFDMKEFDRERERERERRENVASLVSGLVQAISSRNRAIRSLGLFTALEKRSQIRVQKGIVSVSEQVKYLEKVINWEDRLSKANAKITESRLALIGQCRDGERAKVNGYLNFIINNGGVGENESKLKMDYRLRIK